MPKGYPKNRQPKEPITVKTEKAEVTITPEPGPEEKKSEMREGLELLRDQHEEAQEDKKPRKERKKKADYEQEIAELNAKLQGSPVNQEAVKDGVALGNLLLDLSDGAFGNKQNWTQTERAIWSDSFGKIFAKYMPKLGDWQTDIAFLVATGGLVLPRIIHAKKEKEASSET